MMNRSLQDHKVPLRYRVVLGDPESRKKNAGHVSEDSETSKLDRLLNIHSTDWDSVARLKTELLTVLDKQVARLDRGIEDISQFRSVTLSRRLKIHEQDEFLDLKNNCIEILDQARKDFWYLKSSHHIYMMELGRMRLRILDAIILQALTNPRIMKRSKKSSPPMEIQIFSQILQGQAPKKVFTAKNNARKMVECLLFRKRRIKKGYEDNRAFFPAETPFKTPFKTPPTTPSHLSPLTLSKDRGLSISRYIDREANLSMVFMKAIERGSLTESDRSFLATLTIPAPAGTGLKDSILKDMTENFLVRLISPRAFESAVKEWRIGIELAFVDIHEEELIHIIKSARPYGLETKYGSKLHFLSSRQTIIRNLSRNIDVTHEIQEKLNSGRCLTKNEVDFLRRNFFHELKPIRAALEAAGYPYLTYDFSGIIAPNLMGHMFLNYQAQQWPQGNYLKYALTDSEAKLLRFPRRLNIQRREPHSMLKELNELKGFSENIRLCRPPTLIELIESSARNEASKIGSLDIIAQKQLSSLQETEPLKFLHATITRLPTTIQEYGLLLLREEHKYLENMTWEDKGKKMLQIVNACHVYPPSPQEQMLWVNVMHKAPLINDQRVLLQKLSELYDIVILNTMSENEVVLSRLSRFEDEDPMGKNKSKDNLYIDQLKSILKPICNSPLKKYILYKSVEKYYPHTMEGIVLTFLNDKRKTIGYLSIWETSIYNRYLQPLWKRDVESPEEKKVLNEIYSKSLENELTSEITSSSMRQLLESGSTSDISLCTHFTEAELVEIGQIRQIILEDSLPPYNLQMTKLRLSNLFDLASSREYVGESPQICDDMLQFYTDQMSNLSKEMRIKVSNMHETARLLEDQVLSLREWSRSVWKRMGKSLQ